MLIKASQLCTDAMRLAGYISGNRTPSAEDANIALGELQGMIDLWHTEKLMQVSTKQYNVTGFAGGMIRIGNDPFYELQTEQVPVGISSVQAVSNGDLIPLTAIPTEQYAKSFTSNTSSIIPDFYRFEGGATYGELYLYPQPVNPIDLVVTTQYGLSVPNTLNDDMSLPPGWMQTVKYCLASLLVLPLGIPQDAITADLTAKAASYKERLKATKTRVSPKIINYGPMGISRSQTRSWSTDE
jgi:hypothetical protein